VLLKTAIVCPLTQLVFVPTTASATFCPWVTTDGETDEIAGVDCGDLRDEGFETGLLERLGEVDESLGARAGTANAVRLLARNKKTSSKQSDVLTERENALVSRPAFVLPRPAPLCVRLRKMITLRGIQYKPSDRMRVVTPSSLFTTNLLIRFSRIDRDFLRSRADGASVPVRAIDDLYRPRCYCPQCDPDPTNMVKGVVVSTPRPVVMVTGPVVPAATVATIFGGVTWNEAAGVPLNETELTPEEKPIPVKVT